jgi:hypothetical protein
VPGERRNPPPSAAAGASGTALGRRLRQIPGLELAKPSEAGGQKVVYLPTMTCNSTAVDVKNQTLLTCHNGTSPKTTDGEGARAWGQPPRPAAAVHPPTHPPGAATPPPRQPLVRRPAPGLAGKLKPQYALHCAAIAFETKIAAFRCVVAKPAPAGEEGTPAFPRGDHQLPPHKASHAMQPGLAFPAPGSMACRE